MESDAEGLPASDVLLAYPSGDESLPPDAAPLGDGDCDSLPDAEDLEEGRFCCCPQPRLNACDVHVLQDVRESVLLHGNHKAWSALMFEFCVSGRLWCNTPGAQGLGAGSSARCIRVQKQHVQCQWEADVQGMLVGQCWHWGQNMEALHEAGSARGTPTWVQKKAPRCLSDRQLYGILSVDLQA